MIIEPDKIERLKFLRQVIKKEIKHLNYSANKLFSSPFTLERAQELNHNEELAEQLEAFSSRFCRLQDTIGNRDIAK